MTTNTSYTQTTPGSEVVDAFKSQVTGRNILITGVGPAGIGEATLDALAAASPNLITVTGRSISKVEASIKATKEKYPEANIKPLIMDLSSFASIRAAAAEFNATPENLDILINNAGVMSIPERTLSEDGIEMQFATNHIGHFLFTNLILNKLIAAAKDAPKGQTRIINVSSAGHMAYPIRFSDWNWEGLDADKIPEEEKGNIELLTMFGETDFSFTKYTAGTAYGQSKAANLLFSVQLTKMLFEKYGILSLGLHPGAIFSQLQRHLSEEQTAGMKEIAKTYFFKSKEQGASTQLVAALDPKLNEWEKSTGYYLDNCQFAFAMPWATDEAIAEKLWKLSEEIVGEKFEI